MATTIDKSEQWKLSGDCNLCRRQKYCSKPCTVNKRATFNLAQSLVRNKLDEMTSGAYSTIMNTTSMSNCQAGCNNE